VRPPISYKGDILAIWGTICEIMANGDTSPVLTVPRCHLKTLFVFTSVFPSTWTTPLAASKRQDHPECAIRKPIDVGKCIRPDSFELSDRKNTIASKYTTLYIPGVLHLKPVYYTLFFTYLLQVHRKRKSTQCISTGDKR